MSHLASEEKALPLASADVVFRKSTGCRPDLTLIRHDSTEESLEAGGASAEL
jgi:hypothetical protein